MSNAISSLFEFISAFIIFLTALSLVVYNYNDVLDGFDELTGHETVFIQSTEIPEEVKWTGAQVAGKLFRISENDIPIQVDSTTFIDDADVIENQSVIYLDGNYMQTIEFDSDGKAAKIIFTLE